MSHAHHRLLALLIGGSLAGLPTLHAESVVVDVSVTIAASTLDVMWSAADGSATSNVNRTWTLAAAALSGTYVTGTDGVLSAALTLFNNTPTNLITIEAKCSDSASWQVAGSVGVVNKFKMSAKVGAGSYTALANTDTTGFLTNMAYGVPGIQAITLQLLTPTSINAGGGVAQSIAVTFTATAQ